MAYGYITSTDEYKQQLRNLNRNYEGRKVWDELYGQIGLSQQRAENLVRQDYLTNLSEAYSSAYNQKAAVANSALGTGYKQQAIEDLDFALSEAFDSYRQNYLTQKSQIEENALAANQAIDDALTKQAENTILYQDSFFSYLEDLWNRAEGLGKYEDIGVDTTLQNMFKDDMLWSRYTVKDGTDTHLIDSSELYAQLYDENKLITDKGIEFYDQMFNRLGVTEGKDYSFHKYLSDTNPELYEWSIADNPYDYTTAGTNMGTFKTLMGLDSIDNEYKFIERSGAFTSGELESMMSYITDDLDDISTSGKNKDSVKAFETFEEAADKLQDYVNTLEIDPAKKDDITYFINNYKSHINEDDLYKTGFLRINKDDKKSYNENLVKSLKREYLSLVSWVAYEVTKK